MKDNNKRRSFLKTIALGGLGTALVPAGASASMDIPARGEPAEKQPNQTDINKFQNSPIPKFQNSKIACLPIKK